MGISRLLGVLLLVTGLVLVPVHPVLADAPPAGIGDGNGCPRLCPVEAETKGLANSGRPPVLS